MVLFVLTLARTCKPYIILSLVSKNVLSTSGRLCLSPRVEAMHVADVSRAFCKLCKLLLRKTSATALPPTLGLWNPLDVAGFVWDNTGYCV